MALLVGDSSTAAYTTNTFTNFGGHAANSGATQAVASGSIDTCGIYVNSWGTTTSIRLAIYEGVDAASADDLVATFLYTSAQGTGEITAAPEVAASITSGLYYRIKHYFDPSAAETDTIQLWRDVSQTIASGQGISTSLTGSFATPDDPLNTAELTNEQQDGIFYFNVDGTVAGTTGTLSETQDSNTSTGSGSLGSAISGTLSEVGDNNTVTSSGVVVYSGSLNQFQDAQSSAASGLIWHTATYTGPAPDIETTNSFYELAINDLGFTAEVNDVLYFTSATGLTVDGQWIPTIDPASDVTGFYYIYDASLDTFTSTQAYTIDQRYSGEVVETQDSNTSSGSGSISITGTVVEDLSGDTLSSTGAVGSGAISGTVSYTQQDNSLSASGSLLVIGLFSEVQDSQTLASTGSLTQDIVGTLSFNQLPDTLAASGTVALNITASLSDVQENNTPTTSALVGNLGSSTITQEDQSSTGAGISAITGILTETQEANTAASSGNSLYEGTILEAQDSGTVTAVGLVGLIGSLSLSQENNASTVSGVVALNISGAVSISQAANISNVSGEAGLTELVDRIVAQMIIWLPANNVLTEDQMATLVVPIVASVGSTEEDEPEILCKALKSAAYINKAKASTHYALTKEKVRDGEYGWSTGSKSPKELWQDYIDELANICPLFGYTGSPSTIGIKANSGPTIDPLKNCKSDTFLF